MAPVCNPETSYNATVDFIVRTDDWPFRGFIKGVTELDGSITPSTDPTPAPPGNSTAEFVLTLVQPLVTDIKPLARERAHDFSLVT